MLKLLGTKCKDMYTFTRSNQAFIEKVLIFFVEKNSDNFWLFQGSDDA